MNGGPRAIVNEPRVKWWIISGLSHFALVLTTGFLYGLQFLNAYPLAGIEVLSPGRLRAVHTTAVAYGFLSSLLLGLWEYVIPRLTGRPVWNQTLGWACLLGWNAVVIAGYTGILAGRMQALEWAEIPTFIDPFVVLVFAGIAANFLQPVLADRGRNQYVSIWYFGAAMIWTALNYVVGNYVPQYIAPGAAGAAVASMYIHDLVGLLVTPLGWGLMYYMVPVALGRPIWSHRLSLIGFWLLAFFYPLNSVHHYLWSPIPMWVQQFSIVSSVGVHAVVWTVAWNFVATAWGAPGLAWRSLPLRYFFTGVAFYVLTCIQCATQVQLAVQQYVHFTDWVVGHAHFIMFGAFGLWMLGLSQYLWPRLVGAKAMHSGMLSEAHWWLSTLGMGLMWVDLTIAGLVEGFTWTQLSPFTASIHAAIPFWTFRMFAGLAIALGQVLYFWNFFQTWREGRALQLAKVRQALGPAEPVQLPSAPLPAVPPPEREAPPPPSAPPHPVHEHPEHRRAYERTRFVLMSAGAGMFTFSFLALGLLPFLVKGNLRVDTVSPARVPTEFKSYYKTPEEYKKALVLGRDLYISENCWNCHTQYVRPVSNEVERYGPVARMEEYQNDLNLPQLFGTRRVGPDLSREHGKHSNDWHFAHLYDPRLVVPESVMPSYPWFFDEPRAGEAPRPNERGIALVAYLQWLGTLAEELESERAKEVAR